MSRRFLALLVVLFAAAPPGLARAQDDDAAAADTSAAAALLEVLRPRYDTLYQVERQTTTWGQNFDFGAGFGIMNFNNRASFEVKRDNDRDEERRDGRNRTDLRWFFIPGLPLHMSLNAGRTSVTNPKNEVKRDEMGSNLSLNYKTYLLGISHTVDAGGGYDRRKDSSTSTIASSVTTDAGVNANLNYRLKWFSRREVLTVDGTFKEQRSDRTLELEKAGSDTVETQPSSSTSRYMDGSVGYRPGDWFTVKMNASDDSRREQRYVLQSGIGELDNQESDKTNFDADLRYKPTKTVELGLRGNLNDYSSRYKVREELAAAGTSRFGEASVKRTGSGLTVDAKLSVRRDRLEPAVGDTSETEADNFEGKLTRRLNHKFTTQFDWLVRADRIYFQNSDPADRFDRDELKTKVQPSLIYTPTPTWTVTTTYIRSVSRRVEVNPLRATQTRREEDYTVDFNISHRFSAATQMSQTYSIKALTTLFDYVPEGDRLLATQRITTNVTSQVTPKVLLTMDHRFTLQDSGPYQEEAGSRVFARSLRTYTQEMASSVEYKVVPWFSVNTSSRFGRIDKVNEATQTRTITRNLEIKHGFNIARVLAGGLNFSARGSYINSNVRDAYWTLSSTLSKDF